MTANEFRVIEGGRGMGCGFLSDTEIAAYLSGDLEQDRLEAFASHCLSDCRSCALFGADLRTYREVSDRGLLESERRHFDEIAAAQRARFATALAAEPARVSRRFPSWLLGVAATIAVVGFLGVQFLVPGTTSPAIDLPDGSSFAFEAPVVSSIRDGGAFTRGRTAFAEGDYAAAALAFEAVETENPLYGDALFLAGVSRLIEGRSEDASALLRRALASYEEHAIPADEVRYYLALASIELGKTDIARTLLESVDPGSQFPTAELLEALR